MHRSSTVYKQKHSKNESIDWSPVDYCDIKDYYDVFISCLDSHTDGTHS